MSSINAPYFTNEMRSEVLRMLGLRQDAFKKGMLRIRAADKEDSVNRRIILHYDPETLENMQMKTSFTKAERDEIVALAACRGIIIDLETMTIIKKSFPQTINVPTTFVPLHMNNPILSASGEVIPEWGQYKSYYGGTLLHSYWYKGEVYMSTFSHFDATNSHFGDSDNFVALFYKNQDVIKSINDLYPDGCDTSEIHIFILNDRKLLVDTREEQDQDRVIYLKSFSLNDKTKPVTLVDVIHEGNKFATKPIVFCKILTPIEVNERLKGLTIDVSEEYNGDRYELLSKFKNFFGGEKVIYEHSWGICTLVPPSCKFRQNIMEGKNNISKLFVDCMADFKNDKGLVDVVFSMKDCLAIADKLMNGKIIYVDDYQLMPFNKQLQVLTNLLFVVPLNRIPEVLSAYNEFDEKIAGAVNHLIRNYEDIERGIRNDKLATFPGITSTKFREYLCKRIPKLMYSETEFNDEWPDVLKNMYMDVNEKISNSEMDQETQTWLDINMGIISMIGDAYGDVLYTFLTFEDKFRKAKLAFEKHIAKKNIK